MLVGKVAAIAAETNAALMKIFDLKTDADVARAAAADHTLPRATLRIRPRSASSKDFSRSKNDFSLPSGGSRETEVLSQNSKL